MKLKFLLILALVSTAFGQGQNFGNGGGGTNTVGSGPQNTWQVQTTACGSNTSCTQIFGDGQVALDASTTLNSSTITCPNSDCNFVAGDVGKVAWVTAQGSGIGQYSFGALICPLSTISTVNSAQSITLTAASDCTGTAQTATGILVWGHKDGTTLHNMTPGCATVYFPANTIVLWDQSFLITVPSCASGGSVSATGIPQPGLNGQNSNVQLIMTPDFNWSSCTGTGAVSGGVCLGSALSQMWQFGIWGTGATGASNSNCANGAGKTVLAMNSRAGAIYFVNMSGICPGTALTGVELNSLDEQWKEGGAQNVGLNAACVVSSNGVITESLDCHNFSVTNGVGLHVLTNGKQNDTGTFCYGSVLLDGSLTSRNAHFQSGLGSVGGGQDAVTVNSGGKWISDGDSVNIDACGGVNSVGLFLNSGSKAVSRNTVYSAPNGSGTAISDSGTFTDHGGNTIFGTPLVSLVPDTIGGDQVLFGSCTGTDTAAGTIQFTNLGMLSPISTTTQTCTAAASTSGPAMVRAGTLIAFTCASSAQGVNASDGVCTVLKNNVATTLTCTIGNAAPSSGGRFYCVDNSHSVAYAIGDVITVQVATQAATTLANQRVTLLAW